ncbi:hypothetical protein [Actinokineospora sp. NBRC 105648]|uniref:hypothetical protein n=1 Tax=Actinokineospora sp. NBRC 105648 TaxID=3032206 RepID=UPI002554FAF2|nr:hypothetical protein [Actinokineospora sp. NBRC 105648]
MTDLATRWAGDGSGTAGRDRRVRVPRGREDHHRPRRASVCRSRPGTRSSSVSHCPPLTLSIFDPPGGAHAVVRVDTSAGGDPDTDPIKAAVTALVR